MGANPSPYDASGQKLNLTLASSKPYHQAQNLNILIQTIAPIFNPPNTEI